MFLCDDCATGRVDPFDLLIAPRSHGPCEVCGRTRVCADLPRRCVHQDRNTREDQS